MQLACRDRYRSQITKNRFSLSLVFIIVITLLPNGYSQEKFPSPVGYVNDFADVIPANIERKIDAICREINQKTGAEIVIVSVATIGDEDYTDYANRLFENWGIGQRGKDNGILLFNTIAERRFRLEVGYGLEPVIPDGLAGEIRDNYVFPYFRQDDYGNGFLAGTQAVATIIANDAGVELTGGVPIQPVRRVTRKRNVSYKFFTFLMMVIIFMFFRGGGGRRGRRRLWPWVLLGGMIASSESRGFGGGGGFGGGFGGFGGGMSGGGGAGGSY